MNSVEQFEHQVVVLEQDVWIPLSSDHRLAARIWLPENAEMTPVPALLEYLPYRKRDMTRNRDEPTHHYLAGHGYASVRVDLRGAGDSYGTMDDEYTHQELDDGVEVIVWLAAQSWCSGRVGMFGISWGGFNSLQIAAKTPPALKAIITSCSTDDRYTDDMHYSGGCLLNDHLDWATTFFCIRALPGDPLIMGQGWRDNWMDRLDAISPPLSLWLHHQRRDEYWQHGSVNENHDAIECPVFAVGGWLDGYTSASLAYSVIFRFLALDSSVPTHISEGIPNVHRHRPLDFYRRRCVGGTTGSKIMTAASWKNPCLECTWRTTFPQQLGMNNAPVIGWERTPGRVHESKPKH